jgi:biopolymer transport protein ExbD
MAEIAEGGGGHGKGGKKRAKKQSTRVDMTPMVDLAFLLLTFFVLTSTFSKPKAMELALPAKPKPEDPISEIKNGLTFLLSDEDRVFWYAGQFYDVGNEKGLPPTTLNETDYSANGLHKLLLEKNEWAINEKKRITEEGIKNKKADTTIARLVNKALGDKIAITVLVKTDDKATYRNAIDILDELKVCDVGKRVIGVDMMPQEYVLLQAAMKTKKP